MPTLPPASFDPFANINQVLTPINSTLNNMLNLANYQERKARDDFAHSMTLANKAQQEMLNDAFASQFVTTWAEASQSARLDDKSGEIARQAALWKTAATPNGIFGNVLASKNPEIQEARRSYMDNLTVPRADLYKYVHGDAPIDINANPRANATTMNDLLSIVRDQTNGTPVVANILRDAPDRASQIVLLNALNKNFSTEYTLDYFGSTDATNANAKVNVPKNFTTKMYSDLRTTDAALRADLADTAVEMTKAIADSGVPREQITPTMINQAMISRSKYTTKILEGANNLNTWITDPARIDTLVKNNIPVPTATTDPVIQMAGLMNDPTTARETQRTVALYNTVKPNTYAIKFGGDAPILQAMAELNSKDAAIEVYYGGEAPKAFASLPSPAKTTQLENKAAPTPEDQAKLQALADTEFGSKRMQVYQMTKMQALQNLGNPTIPLGLRQNIGLALSGGDTNYANYLFNTFKMKTPAEAKAVPEEQAIQSEQILKAEKALGQTSWISGITKPVSDLYAPTGESEVGDIVKSVYPGMYYGGKAVAGMGELAQQGFETITNPKTYLPKIQQVFVNEVDDRLARADISAEKAEQLNTVKSAILDPSPEAIGKITQDPQLRTLFDTLNLFNQMAGTSADTKSATTLPKLVTRQTELINSFLKDETVPLNDVLSELKTIPGWNTFKYKPFNYERYMNKESVSRTVSEYMSRAKDVWGDIENTATGAY